MNGETVNPGKLDELLPPEQLAQIRGQLIAILRHGFGRLEIDIGHHHVRRVVPRRAVRSPGAQALFPLGDPNLFGDWEPAFIAGMAEIMDGGWGTLAVIVEYGRVSGLDIALSLSAAQPGDYSEYLTSSI